MTALWRLALLAALCFTWGSAYAASIVPEGGKAGQTLTVTINGSYFEYDTVFDFGEGITVTSLVIESAELARATLQISSEAELGERAIYWIPTSGAELFLFEVPFIVLSPQTEGVAIKSIASGSLIAEAAFVTEDNQIHVWGFRGSGQSGNGITVQDTTLVNIHPRASRVGDNLDYPYNLRDENGNRLEIAKVHTNAHTLFALTEDGDLWAWGQNHHGSAGCDRIAAELNAAKGWSAVPCMVFHKNHPDPAYRVRIADIDGGEYWHVARSVDGRVFTWGRNLEGQIGDGRTTKVNDFSGFDNHNRQKPVDITYQFEGEKVHLTGGAYEHGYAITSNDEGIYTLWGWGDNEGCGALIVEKNAAGNDLPCLYGVQYRYSKPMRTPMASDLVKKITYIAGGNGWGTALLDDGRVIGWGVISALGQGYTYNGAQVKYPIEIHVPYGDTTNQQPVQTLICRYLGCVAVTESGKVYTWGITGGSAYPVYGAWPTPRPINGTLKAIGASKESYIYVNTDNQLYHIGYNNIWRGSLCYEFVRSYNYETERWEYKDSANWPGRQMPVSLEAPWLELDTAFCANPTQQLPGYDRVVTRKMYREWSNFDQPEPDSAAYPEHVNAWHTYCTWPAITPRWPAPTEDNPWAQLPAYCKGTGEEGTRGVSYHTPDGPTWTQLSPKPQEVVR